MKLLSSPFIRIIGVIVILYLGLFTNTHEKDSLGNRLSKERVKKNLDEAKEKGFYIIHNVKKAKELQQEQTSRSTIQKTPQNIIYKDIKPGSGLEANCDDLVTISYKIFADNKQLETIEKLNLIIGKNQIDSMIESKIIGLKENGVRLIILPDNYRTNDKQLNNYLLAYNNHGINYEINLLEVKKSSAKIPVKCNFN